MLRFVVLVLFLYSNEMSFLLSTFWAKCKFKGQIKKNEEIKFIFSCELNKSRIAGGNYNFGFSWSRSNIYQSLIGDLPSSLKKNSESMDTWSMFYFVMWSFGWWFYNSRQSGCALYLLSTLYSKEIAALRKAWCFCQLKCFNIDDGLYVEVEDLHGNYEEDRCFFFLTVLSGHSHTRDLCMF